ncbi:hypothetical protein F0562_031784 [Nyssa sinensis]|uniref:Target of rapamycin complex subunit LST8 n=1 Tax=Nyssa sinensis TaxID=561372 RepID=A0A5J5AXV2_9ASTE|nr:hypothetical protein F0562_031784 [Nyssa sinensis]
MSILSLGNENGDVGLFNFTTRTITRENYANNVVKCLKFSTDGAKLFAAIGNMVYEVETEDLHKVTRVYKAPSVITDFSVHWEGGHKLLYTCSDRLIQLWDARNIQPYRTFTHGFKLNCIDILSQEHVLVTGDSRGSVQSWNVRTMSPTYEYDYV